MVIVWSAILPCRKWCGAWDKKGQEKVRKKANKGLRNALQEGGLGASQWDVQELSRADGVHLSRRDSIIFWGDLL